MPLRRRALPGIALPLLAALRPGPARAAAPAWPARCVRMIVACPPGGGTDLLALAGVRAGG